ncbi:MAG: hypothetical protein J6Z49_03010 [Kiritimatiellae bacterium]|nr:hypothetical protein [Kiritimatiellia bacterium]
MNIQDIMLRDIRDEERKQRERDECGFPWLVVAVWIAVALTALVAAFVGGMCFQIRCDLKADRDFAAWCDRVEREATERARAMSNYELLNATRRECADAANR